MKIKSRTDVITNSSTEVFCFKLDGGKYKRLKEKLGPLSSRFTELRTLDDLKKIVLDPDNNFEGIEDEFFKWQQCRLGDSDFEFSQIPFDPYSYDYGEIIRGLKESGKSNDEIWDFFKDLYKPIIGNALYQIGEGEEDPEFSEVYDSWADDEYVLKLQKAFKDYKPGDIVCMDPTEMTKEAGYDDPCIFLLCKPSDPEDPFPVALASCYHRAWEWLDTDTEKHPEFKCGVIVDSSEVTLGSWVLESLRHATPEEEKKFMDKLSEAGYEINPENYEIRIKE